jgi:hypothetical protein
MDAILKVFSDFYPDEYDLLRLLNRDERAAINALLQQPLAAQHLLGYGLLDRTKNSYRFTMEALPSYLSVAPPAEFKQVEVPNKTRERLIKLQGYMNNIEIALRSLVMMQFKATFGKEWQEELLKHFQEVARMKIESLGPLSAQQLMEESYLSDLLRAISGHWKLFAKVFEQRDAYNEHSKFLVEVARSVSDHRKLLLCADDAKYIRAYEACEWFTERLLR